MADGYLLDRGTLLQTWFLFFFTVQLEYNVLCSVVLVSVILVGTSRRQLNTVSMDLLGKFTPWRQRVKIWFLLCGNGFETDYRS